MGNLEPGPVSASFVDQSAWPITRSLLFPELFGTPDPIARIADKLGGTGGKREEFFEGSAEDGLVALALEGESEVTHRLLDVTNDTELCPE